MNGIATPRDIARVDDEAGRAALAASTYEIIRRGVAIDPSAPARSYFITADVPDRGSGSRTRRRRE